MNATPASVRIATGELAGTATSDGVRVFRGIPYAAPPVGPLRWKPPQAPAPWTGVREASAFGHDPMQLDEPAARGSLAPGMSEDCLTLNIWAPAQPQAGGAPVMVWFDGGGFIACSGAKARTDGANFARRGVVLVTVNYRVGAFGFLAHPQLTAESEHRASGNYGFLDHIAALAWVRDNIAAFGGDPGRVTAFGFSAGGASTGLLLLSPLARGLFHRVILQSPGSFRSLCPLADAETAGLVAGGDLAAMRALPAADVLALNAKINPAVRGLTVPRPLRPIIDGWSIDRDEVAAFRSGAFAAVPAIVGSNANEGGYFTKNIPVTTTDALREYVRGNFGEAFGEAWMHYGAEDDARVTQAVADAFGDAQFSYGARSLAEVIAERQPLTFRYVFTHAGALTSEVPVHGDEVAYVFGNGDFSARDRALSDTVMAAWTNFAASGDPNGAGVPRWSGYEPMHDNYLAIGSDLAEAAQWRAEPLGFIDRFFRSRAGK